jgi:hypothetical protein
MMRTAPQKAKPIPMRMGNSDGPNCCPNNVGNVLAYRISMMAKIIKNTPIIASLNFIKADLLRVVVTVERCAINPHSSRLNLGSVI